MQLASPNLLFQWSPLAQCAFDLLKQRVISVPILSQPDLTQQFIVEVDVFYCCVEAVLLQNKEGKKRPCAFFSCSLFPAKQNYNVRYQELLASKLALEEWRCWLKGLGHTFIMWTDHMNLAYLQTA